MRVLTLLLPLALLTGTAALATEHQTHHSDPAGKPATTAPAPRDDMPMMKKHGMMNCPMMSGERVEGRIAFLKTELAITPAQDAVWNDFAQALRADAESTKSHRDMMHDGMDAHKGMDMPLAMNARISMMEQKLALMKTMQAATEKLYAVLTDEQKKTANELLSPYH